MTSEQYKSQYYKKILDIVQDYLGPAAERFIVRQISTHLEKDPERLEKSDIPMLAIRIRSGLHVLTHDQIVVEEAFRRISSIVD
jgi:hypothetical protein